MIGTPFSLHHLKNGLNPGSSWMSVTVISGNHRVRGRIELTLLQYFLALIKRRGNTFQHLPEGVTECNPVLQDLDVKVSSIYRGGKTDQYIGDSLRQYIYKTNKNGRCVRRGRDQNSMVFKLMFRFSKD